MQSPNGHVTAQGSSQCTNGNILQLLLYVQELKTRRRHILNSNNGRSKSQQHNFRFKTATPKQIDLTGRREQNK